MRKFRLKDITIEKQMTVVLPIAMAILLLIGTLTVNRLRAVRATSESNGEGKTVLLSDGLPLSEPLRIVFSLHQADSLLCTLMQLTPSGELTFSDISGDIAAQLYQQSGIMAVRDAWGAQYYADFTFDGWQRMFAVCGERVTVYLSEGYAYRDKGGLQVTFPAGRVQLSGYQAVDLLYAAMASDAGGEIAALLHKALCLQSFQVSEQENLFTRFTTVAATDIRIYDFEKYLPVLQALSDEKS